jgi:mono/diheme cytochrome c family protein
MGGADREARFPPRPAGMLSRMIFAARASRPYESVNQSISRPERFARTRSRSGKPEVCMKTIGTLLSIIGALAIIVAAAAAVYFLGGFYNVAATQEDPWIVKKALEEVREASINRYAPRDTPPVAMEDPAVVQAGARAYAKLGCIHCHGTPVGDDWSKFSEGLHPGAADLKTEVRELTAEQIFWVVKNGINMTGMPSFGRPEVTDDEIWKVAAFVKQFPDVSPDSYKAWTAETAAPAPVEPPKADAPKEEAPPK